MSTATCSPPGVRWWQEDRIGPVLLRTFPDSARLSWAVGVAAFLCFSSYRGVLWWMLARSAHPPLGFVIERFWFHEFLSASGWDLLAAGLLAMPFRFFGGRTNLRRKLLWGVGFAVVWVSTLICVVHFKLLVVRGEYVGFEAAREAIFGAMTLHEALGYATGVERLLLLAPVPIWVGSVWVMLRLSELGRLRIAAVAAGLLAIVGICALLPHHNKFRPHFHQTPVVFGTIDVAKGLAHPASHLSSVAADVSPVQARSIQFVDSQFLDLGRRSPPARSTASSSSGSESPDVVFVIMESVRRMEVFRETPDGSIAMPFLKTLADESWWMVNHHSSSNSSHRSLFSIFTGLYPSFGRSYFCIADAVAVPTVSSFLPAKYERFLYTPGDLRSYFPRVLLEKSGMTDLYGRSDLLDGIKRKATSIALHEFDALEPFLERIQKARGPIFAVYYSYVPHFSYRQFGPEYQVFEDVSVPRNRYANNLRVLDHVIEAIVEQLKSSGRWDNTVLVIVGDHGESFGERGLFTHANDLHEEQINTPWLLRFPGVRPRLVEELTSHVDILPTVLDTMSISSDPAMFQGESLWNEQRRRRYVFGVGNERSFYSIDQARTKLIFKDRTDTCLRYDLSRDPGERSPGSCASAPRHFQALADFRAFQSGLVQRYSRADAPNKPPLLPR